jgi:hypothetical protein
LVVKREDLDLSGESLKCADRVFLEQADEPTDLTYKIPMGLLILTNKKLLFLSKETPEKLDPEKPKFFRVVRWGWYSAFHPPEIKEKDVEPIINSKYSFVIPVERLISVEKIEAGFGITKYLRIEIMQDNGVKTNYYLYSIDPTSPSGYYVIDIDTWFDWLNDAIGVMRYETARKMRKRPLVYKISDSFLFGILGAITVVVLALGFGQESFHFFILLLSMMWLFFIFVFTDLLATPKGLLLFTIIILAIIDGMMISTGTFDWISVAVFPIIISVLVIILVKLTVKKVT